MDLITSKDHEAKLKEILKFETKYAEWLPHSMLIDIDRIPKKMKDFIVKYMMLQVQSTPASAMVHAVIANIARLAGNNRCTVTKPEGGVTPIHAYTMLFMKSGAGKDKSFDKVQEIMDLAKKELSARIFRQKSKYNSFLIGEYEKMCSDDPTFKKINPKVDKWVSENKVEIPPDSVGFATGEGLSSMAVKFNKIGIGAVNIVIPEFLQRMGTNEMVTDRFIELISDIYDNGRYKVKATKTCDVATETDGSMREIKCMNTNIHVHSDPSGLKDMPQSFMVKVRQSLIRRFITCYITDEDFILSNFAVAGIEDLGRKAFDESRVAMKSKAEWEAHFMHIFELTFPEKLGDRLVHKNIEFDDDANIFLSAYEVYCRFRQQIHLDNTEGVEIGNRQWRAWKIAAIIAIFDLRTTVTKQDAYHAMYLTEHFGIHAKRFLSGATSSNVAAKEVLKYIIEMTRTQKYVIQSKIYELPSFPSRNKSALLPELMRMLPDIKLYAMEMGLDVVQEKHATSMRWYVKPLPEIHSAVKYDNTSDIITRFEQTLSNKQYDLSEFEDELPF